MSYRLFGRVVLSALFLVPLAIADDTWTVSLLPADIYGQPGQTIGWTYSITNDSSTDWLILDAVSADVFSHATPDSSVFDYPIVPPDTNVTGPLFNLTWDTNAPLYFFNTGTFDLTAEWWDGDPLTTGNYIGPALDGYADYSAEVVPEPASIVLTIPPLLLMAWVFRRQAKVRPARI
jgi:hypothetical protein